MKRKMLLRLWMTVIALTLLVPDHAVAFPPALPHTLYGMARDEYGNPLGTNAIITLTTTNGITLSTTVNPSLGAGINYRLVVPLDAGVRLDTYRTDAVNTTVSFRMQVKLNNTLLLPIEMVGNYTQMGKPGQQTRIDLTLGVDANRDGLPDAWELALIAARGWDLQLADLNSSLSPGKNGVTLMQEYIAGTYGFEDGSGLSLNIVRADTSGPVLEFMAVRGRTYTIVGSADLKTWTDVSFQLIDLNADQSLVQSYLSNYVQLMQVTVPKSANQAALVFFKLRIQ